jgi:hypothetical protein
MQTLKPSLYPACKLGLLLSVRAAPLVLGLTACATDGQSNVYRKPGATEATYEKDISDCQRNATSWRSESRQDTINRCMMGKGWIVTREQN